MATTDFDTLCDGPLAPVLSGLEASRQAAVKRFWLMTAGFAALAVVAMIVVPGMSLKLFLVMAILIVGWIVASRPLDQAGRALKEPALAAISGARGLTYDIGGFAADGYEAIHPLFGRPNSRTFRDRFEGEENGRRFVFYEASLVSGSGKSRRTVFNGLIHTLARHPVQGETVVVPDRGLFNVFSPGRGMERVRFEDDPEFERGLEVYSTRPDAARALVNPVVRQQLKAWRTAHGRVFVRLAGDQVTVALAEPGDRFESGSMMKATPGRERVRAIWNDLEAVMSQMRQVAGTLG